MTRFNWSAYPPDPPIPPDPHPLAEKIGLLLENAGTDQEAIDQIVKEIEELAALADRECPHCEARAAEEMMNSYRKQP